MSEGCAVNGCTGRLHANGLCHWHNVNEPDPALLRKPKEKKPGVKRITQPIPVTVKHKGRAVCDECGARDPRKSYRLDPRNLRPTHALLCKPCREKQGYREVNYERPYAEITARSIMRGAV